MAASEQGMEIIHTLVDQVGLVGFIGGMKHAHSENMAQCKHAVILECGWLYLTNK